MRCNGRGAHIDRDAARLVEESRPDSRNQVLLIDGNGHTAVLAGQCALQRAQLGVGEGDPGNTPFAFEGFEQKLHFTPGVIQAGFLYLNVVEPRSGIESDVSRFHFFAHNLSMHLAFGGHVDHGIIEQCGVATQASASFKRALSLFKLFFGLTEGGEVVDVGVDLVLGKRAGHAADLASAAETAPPADRVNVDAQAARRFK